MEQKTKQRLIDANLLRKDFFTVQTQEYGFVDVVSLDCISTALTIDPIHAMGV